jgi:hypothetical protein
MNTWGSEWIVPSSLILAVDVGELSASRTGRFTAGGNTHQYRLNRRLGLTLESGLESGIRGKIISRLCWESNPGRAICH